MSGIDRIPFIFKEIPINPITVGTHDIPSTAIGCVVRVQPQGSGGTGSCTLSYVDGGGLERRWSRYRGGSSGYGHNFGITTQVFFSADKNGKMATKLKLSSTHTVNADKFSITAWISLKTDTIDSAFNTLPFHSDIRAVTINGNRDVTIPKAACGIKIKVRHHDGDNRTATVTFNNKCKPYVWFKNKSGGSGYRYSPVYEDIIWFLSDSDGKYPTSLNITNSEGNSSNAYIRITGWIFANEADDYHGSVNVINPKKFIYEGAPFIGYSETRNIGTLKPIRMESHKYGISFWIEPTELIQDDIEEAVINDEIWVGLLSASDSRFDFGSTTIGTVATITGYTSRTVFLMLLLICDTEVMGWISGLRISDVNWITNPLNLTNGKDTSLNIITIDVNTPYLTTTDRRANDKAFVNIDNYLAEQQTDLKTELKKHGINIIRLHPKISEIIKCRYIESDNFQMNRRSLLQLRNNLMKDPEKYKLDLK